MPSEIYLLYSTKLNSWFAGSTGTSDWTKASKYTKETAIAMARRHYSKHDETLGMIAVPLTTVEMIAE